jgi:RNA polymerase sigma-70 factor (ECF subfamily)
MVALFSCRIGVQHIDSIEDAVQSALMRAVQTWSTHTTPDNPSAWIYRVAHNNLMGELRKATRQREILLETKRSNSGRVY